MSGVRRETNIAPAVAQYLTGILYGDIWGRIRFDVDLFASMLRVEDPGLAS